MASTKKPLAQCLAIAFIGVPSILAFLFLMFTQIGIFNLNELASGALLIPLQGSCGFHLGRPCVQLNGSLTSACNGPLSCPGAIVDIFMMKGVRVIGVFPTGPTKNDTTVGDVVNMILGDTSHLIPFVILLSGQVLSWICLLIHQVNNGIIKGISSAIFIITRISGYVAVYLNTQAILNDIRLNIDHPPSLLAAINAISPWLAFTIMLTELPMCSLFFWQPKCERSREPVFDLEDQPIILND